MLLYSPFLIIFLWFTNSWCEKIQEFLSNGDMSVLVAGKLSNWVFDQSKNTGEFIQDIDTPDSKVKYSGKLNCSKYQSAYVLIVQKPILDENADYIFSGWYKVDTGTTKSSIAILATPFFETMPRTIISKIETVLDNKWHYFENKFNSGEYSEYNVSIKLNSIGIIWLTNLSLKTVIATD
ncbi:MAG: hypothetical protein AABY84_05265 [Candidatus Firestonebacteria bacterium]